VSPTEKLDLAGMYRPSPDAPGFAIAVFRDATGTSPLFFAFTKRGRVQALEREEINSFITFLSQRAVSEAHVSL
jgi:hypothetical protein